MRGGGQPKTLSAKGFAGSFCGYLAFTLAEVLITLGIIGIVAAMTLPALNAKYKKNQTAIQVEKSFSELSQLLKRSEVDNGSIEYWDFSLSGDDFYSKYLKQYLIKVKEIPNSEFSKYMVYTNLNGQRCTSEVWCTMENSFYSYLVSGAVIGIMSHGSVNARYKAITVDINGDKMPNQLGKDVFVFAISKSRKMLVPYGFYDAGISGAQFVNDDRNKLTDNCEYCCNKLNKGIFCSALIYVDGWKISDDYPW